MWGTVVGGRVFPVQETGARERGTQESERGRGEGCDAASGGEPGGERKRAVVRRAEAVRGSGEPGREESGSDTGHGTVSRAKAGTRGTGAMSGARSEVDSGPARGRT